MAEASTPSFSVTGKTAIVTGAGSGINLAFAELLLSRDCNVVLADVSLRPEAQEVVNRYQSHSKEKSPPRAVFVQTDVSSWPALENMFEKTLAEFGGFDLICPGAGIYEPHWSNFWHPPGSAESRDAPDAGHYALLDINLTHPIRTTQLAISHWLHPRPAKGSSLPVHEKVSPSNPKRVVHISSLAGQLPSFRAPMYGATKFAITGLVRCLAPLDKEIGVRVNAVAPGIVRTPLWTEHPEKNVVIGANDAWITPLEVAEAMLACAENDAYVGGSIVEVGKDQTRLVGMFNDPGPDMDPSKGLVASDGEKGNQMVWGWLGQEDIWGGAPKK